MVESDTCFVEAPRGGGGGVRRLSRASHPRDDEEEGAPELLHLLSLSTEDTSDMAHDFTDDSSSTEVRLVVEVEGWLELAPSSITLSTSAGLWNLLRSKEQSGHSCSNTIHGEAAEPRQQSSMCGCRTHLPSSLIDPTCLVFTSDS